MITMIALPLVATVYAAPLEFKVVSDKLEYRNLVTVESATEFETFTGKTTKITGGFTFDPAKKTGSGKVTIDLASLDTGIPKRNEHMQSDMWLDTGKHPTAVFESTSVKATGADGYKVTGKFTLHGVTKTITTALKLRYRPESADTKRVGFAGDVAHVATKFDVKLADYGIKIPEFVKGKVSPTVTISVSAYATTK